MRHRNDSANDATNNAAPEKYVSAGHVLATGGDLGEAAALFVSGAAALVAADDRNMARWRANNGIQNPTHKSELANLFRLDISDRIELITYDRVTRNLICVFRNESGYSRCGLNVSSGDRDSSEFYHGTSRGIQRIVRVAVDSDRMLVRNSDGDLQIRDLFVW